MKKGFTQSPEHCVAVQENPSKGFLLTKCIRVKFFAICMAQRRFSTQCFGAGFTLLELMITIGIMTIISGVVFFNFPKLNQTVLLNRAARELTLALREAQSRATAVAQLPGAAAGTPFPKNYGIHVKKDSNIFFLFNDKDDDMKCNVGVSPCSSSSTCDPECVKRFEFTHGVKVQNLIPAPGLSLSGDDELNILFYRPDPTTKISGCSTSPCDPNSIGPYKIVISRPGYPGSDRRTVQIWTTGQISISNP